MRRLKVCCLALFALFALGAATAATASAELEKPEVHIVLGETAPGTAEGSLTGEKIAALETELGAALTATKVELKLTVPSVLAELGTYVATFLGIKRGVKECWTAKPGKDEHIVVEGEWHLRHDGDPELLLGIEFLLAGGELIMLCGKTNELKSELKLKIRGSVLGLIQVANMKQVTEFTATLKCTKPGTQEDKLYLTNADTDVEPKLEAELGLGFEKACENVAKPITLKSNRMLEFLF